jgi:aspartate/methionine/tyrosine aminotransferase
MPHSLAVELNETIKKDSPRVLEMMSTLGRELYFPKGILTQTAEAKQKAKLYNATIGIAKEKGAPMHLPSVMKQLPGFTPDEALNYAPSYGHPDLRAEWKRQILEKNPSLKDKSLSLPVVTCGITHGLSLVADLFVEPGDMVLFPDKVWGNYNLVFGVRRGAKISFYPSFSDKGGFDADGFAKSLAGAAGKGKVVVVLNFPNNPSGYTVTEAESDRIAAALVATAEKGCDVVAVCDDAYFGLFYEPAIAKESLFAKLAGKHPRLLPVKLDGATKEDYVWGFRVGFITYAAGAAACGALEKKTAGCVRGVISNDSQLTQSAVLKAMKSPTYAQEKKDKLALMKRRYDAVKKCLARPEFAAAWTPYPFNSGYFMCVKLKDLNAEVYRLHLLDKHGIGVIATSPTDIRIAYSCLEAEQVEDVFARMFQAAKELAGDPKAKDLSLYKEAFEE